jgi:ZIP family zinc transporter/zinc and cadmium transporter
MSPLSQSLLFAVAAAFANVIGGIIVTTGKWAVSSLRYFIALGSGFMLGTVFLEMFPQSIALTQSAPMLVLLGYFIVHIFEHTFASHLHFGEETHHDEVINSSYPPESDCSSSWRYFCTKFPTASRSHRS